MNSGGRICPLLPRRCKVKMWQAKLLTQLFLLHFASDLKACIDGAERACVWSTWEADGRHVCAGFIWSEWSQAFSVYVPSSCMRVCILLAAQWVQCLICYVSIACMPGACSPVIPRSAWRLLINFSLDQLHCEPSSRAIDAMLSHWLIPIGSRCLVIISQLWIPCTAMFFCYYAINPRGWDHGVFWYWVYTVCMPEFHHHFMVNRWMRIPLLPPGGAHVAVFPASHELFSHRGTHELFEAAEEEKLSDCFRPQSILCNYDQCLCRIPLPLCLVIPSVRWTILCCDADACSRMRCSVPASGVATCITLLRLFQM